jgi:hypothetical protein
MHHTDISTCDTHLLEATIEVAKTNPEVARQVLGLEDDFIGYLLSLNIEKTRRQLEDCLPQIKAKLSESALSTELVRTGT